jgi:hypothetical protein
LKTLLQEEHVDPDRWAKEHRRIWVVVATEHLRTYWAEVTREVATVQEFERVPDELYGCGGVRWVIVSVAVRN